MSEKKYCERPGCKAFATQTYNLLDLCDLHYTEALGNEDVECVLTTDPEKEGGLIPPLNREISPIKTDALSMCEAPRGCSRPAIRKIDGKKLCGVHYTGVLNSKRMKGKKYEEIFPQQRRRYKKRGTAAPKPVVGFDRAAPGTEGFRIFITRTRKNGDAPETTFSAVISEKYALEIMVSAMGG